MDALVTTAKALSGFGSRDGISDADPVLVVASLLLGALIVALTVVALRRRSAAGAVEGAGAG